MIYGALWVALCFAHVCVAKEVVVLPMKVCASPLGQHIAKQYADKYNAYFKDWTCIPERET